ncbi:NUDIX domain-containing protein [Paenibacillus sp. MER TA 81-3]|uniref:NUDIX domain-containing protein n=1 Tax=Paenibacillus sp. MER TA 81-3 TaxID=2939573 RepID=UPI00203E664E|nr:NUDIX domain-containing protein [Paenibacillus sp. MER TA 81-3]MCM3337680.1 NUDIX domain-containing protein [Paenibacillus sp. MER TA 81-3]
MNFTWYEWNEISDDKLHFAVMLSIYQGKYILIRHQDRALWEMPGGRREPGEEILHTASREHYEETGAVHFDLTPYGMYSIDRRVGLVCFAEDHDMDTLPQYEIEEIRLVDSLPDNMNYGGLYTRLEAKWNAHKNNMLKKYTIHYNQDGGTSQ